MKKLTFEQYLKMLKEIGIVPTRQEYQAYVEKSE